MANTSKTTPELSPESTSKEDGGDKGLFSTRNLIVGGVVLGGLVAAIVSYSFNAFRKPKSTKKTKKKKTPKEKTGTKTGTVASKTTAPASKPTNTVAPASKPTNTVASKSAISNNDPKKTEEDTAATVEDIDEPGTANLQTEGPVSNEVFQSFLLQSNSILKESSMKDKCAAVYKSGENVGKYLQKEQGVSVKCYHVIDAVRIAGCELGRIIFTIVATTPKMKNDSCKPLSYLQ